ncbi:MAG TPA: hypothetical protein VE954_38500 [Oligoflexus sp.]|uniref:hypothetical protein n=1 Tax=Oligoflexus sp. TaxID=1971216 RepID=UPI002D2B12B8|nr:hypothetical protein [Oligoflexus sp.]HYX39032.1 hypothetical protein [Oligoflexus sp.]
MRYILLVCVVMVWPAPLWGAETCVWSTWSGVASAVLRSAPEWTSLQKKQDLDRSQLDAAGVGPAARAEAQYLAGAPLTREGEAEVRYEWTLERGGKREARQRLAQTQLHLTQAGLETRRSELLRNLAITADRWQQIAHEQDILDETVATYRALIRQFGERAALSPEQDVTLAVFKLARDETLLKSGQLRVESEGFRSQLAYLTGCDSFKLPQEHSKERSAWPEFSNQISQQTSALKRQQEAHLAHARALLDQETVQTIADLAIGPVARWSLDEGSSKPAFGVTASLPIGASQQKATLQVAQAAFALTEVESSLEDRKRAADYARWLSQYRTAVEVLRQGFAETAVKDKHEKMEQLFLAGRVSASLIIEAHRQMYEHLVSRHQIEWKAMEAYWNLRYLTGQIQEADL